MALEEQGFVVTTKAAYEPWAVNEYRILGKGHGSGFGTFMPDGSQATITYICEFNYYREFLVAVLGFTARGGTGGDTLFRSYPDGSLPERHPHTFNFYAVSAEVEPLGADDEVNNPTEDINNLPIWSKAAVKVVFRAPSYAVLEDDAGYTYEYERFTTVDTEVQSDYLTISQTQMTLVSDGVTQLEQGYGITVPCIRQKWTWHQLPALETGYGPDLVTPPMLNTCKRLLGKVNSTTFNGNRPGSVLFTSVEVKRVLPGTNTPNGYFWDLTYHLAIKDQTGLSNPYTPGDAVGWQFIYNPLCPTLNGWDLPTSDGTASGRKLYETGDLHDLFVADY